MYNRLLKINGLVVDIDSKTVIAFNQQSYSLNNPSQRIVSNVSGFSIPATPYNCSILGFSDSFSVFNEAIYEPYNCDLILENIKLISNGKVFIEKIQYGKKGELNRFFLNINAKLDIWQQLKDYKYSEFLVDFLAWLAIPAFNGTFQAFCDKYNYASNEPLKLVRFVGDLFDQLNTAGTDYIDNQIVNHLRCEKDVETVAGGYFSTKLITIFEFISFKFPGYDFDHLAAYPDTIFNDSYASNLRIQLRELEANKTETYEYNTSFSGHASFDNYTVLENSRLISVSANGTTGIITGSSPIVIRFTGGTIPDLHVVSPVGSDSEDVNEQYSTGAIINIVSAPGNTWSGNINIKLIFIKTDYINIGINQNVSLTKDINNLSDVSLFDIVSGFMGVFNVIKSEVGGLIKMYKFDFIDSLVTESFPGSFVNATSKEISFEGLALSNNVKYSTIFETGDPLTGGFKYVSDNKSLVGESDYVTVKGYAPAYRDGLIVLSSVSKNAFKDVCFFIENNTPSQNIDYKFDFNGTVYTASTNINSVGLYSLAGEYSLLKKIIKKPCLIDAVFYVTPYQYSKLSLVRKYIIPELGGLFVLLSISGYNPSNSGEINCKLIKIIE